MNKNVKLSCLLAGLFASLSLTAHADPVFSLNVQRDYSYTLESLDIDGALEVAAPFGLTLDAAYSELYIDEINNIESTLEFDGNIVSAAVNVGNVDASVTVIGGAIGSPTLQANGSLTNDNTLFVSVDSFVANDMGATNTDSYLDSVGNLNVDSEDFQYLMTTIETTAMGAYNNLDVDLENFDQYSDMQIVSMAFNGANVNSSVYVEALGTTETTTTVVGDLGLDITTIGSTAIMGLDITTFGLGAGNVSTITMKDFTIGGDL